MAKTILVVEDDLDLQRLIQFQLEEEDYHVSVASDVDEALAQVKRIRFDLLVTDVRLPKGVDGVEIYRRLKIRIPELKCIVITGYADNDASLRGVKSEVDDWISKPLKMEDLTNTVDRVLNPETIATKFYNLCKAVPGKAMGKAAELFRVDRSSALKKSRKRAFLALYTSLSTGIIPSRRTANIMYSKLYSNDLEFLNQLGAEDAEKSKELSDDYDGIFEHIKAVSRSMGQSHGEPIIPDLEFRTFCEVVKDRRIESKAV